MLSPSTTVRVDDNDAGQSHDDIVVTAAGYEQRIVDAPASISVIGREELQEKRFGSLAEALGDIEGVDVGQSQGETGGLTISIRGMPSDYTLVLVDGRRQNAPGNVTPNGFGETSTSFLPPFSAIDQIEVVRGPMSTLYGSDAMGGVINLITRKVGTRWAGTATGEMTLQENGQYGNIYSGDAYMQGPIVQDLIGLTLRGSYLYREASGLTYDDATGEPVNISRRGPSPVESEIYTLGGRTTLTPHPDHDLWFEAEINRQWYDNSESQLGTGTVQGGYGPELKFNRDNYVLAHSWRTGFADIDTTLTHNSTETLGRTIPPGTPGKVAGDPRTLKASNTILDSRALVPLNAFNLTLGGQYWKAEMTDAVSENDCEFVQWALFAETEWRMAERFKLTLGGRYDDHETFGGKFSPRAYAVWTATDRLTVKGGVSRGFKTPRLDQIAPGIIGFNGQGTRPQIGTPGLKPETSTSYEIGAYYDDGHFPSGHLTAFHNDFTDKIAIGDAHPELHLCRRARSAGMPRHRLFPAGAGIRPDDQYRQGGNARHRGGDASEIHRGRFIGPQLHLYRQRTEERKRGRRTTGQHTQAYGERQSALEGERKAVGMAARRNTVKTLSRRGRSAGCTGQFQGL